MFWELLHEKVKAKYDFRDIQGINKLADAYRCAAGLEGVRLCFGEDMLLVRAGISELSENLMGYRGNSGFFFAYDCEDIMELSGICDDRRCQTLAYFGDKKCSGRCSSRVFTGWTVWCRLGGPWSLTSYGTGWIWWNGCRGICVSVDSRTGRAMGKALQPAHCLYLHDSNLCGFFMSE